MTFFLIAVLATAAVAVRWRGHRRATRVLSAGTLALFLLIGCGPAPFWLLANLQSGYKPVSKAHWDQRNAIVLLGAGTQHSGTGARLQVASHAYSRLIRTVLMYNACKRDQGDCKVLFSSGAPDSGGAQAAQAAQLYASQLMRLGVPAGDLVPETRGTDTWQSAKFASVLLRQLHVDRVVLVSSAIRLRRAERFFSHFGIDLTAVGADYVNAEMSVVPLALNFAATDLALHEYLAMSAYYLFSALGATAVATRPALVPGDVRKAFTPLPHFSWRKTA